MARTHARRRDSDIVHVFNRAAGGRALFVDATDCLVFLRIVERECAAVGALVVAWALLPNHWHFILHLRDPCDLSSLMGRITSARARAWHARRGTRGRGHVYQSRFGSVGVHGPDHLWTAIKYVERNAVAAGFAEDVLAWRWSSAASPTLIALDPDFARPANWLETLSRPLTPKERAKLGRARFIGV
jgi:putative transposase